MSGSANRAGSIACCVSGTRPSKIYWIMRSYPLICQHPGSGWGGVFTSLVVDALDDGAADLLGAVSAPGIYAYVEAALGAWDQRPLFKAHVSRVLVLRCCTPPIDREIRMCDFQTPGIPLAHILRAIARIRRCSLQHSARDNVKLIAVPQQNIRPRTSVEIPNWRSR